MIELDCLPKQTTKRRKEKTIVKLSQVAVTIIEQLGSHAMRIAGLRIHSATEESVTLTYPAEKRSRFTIEYNAGEDIYNVFFYKGRSVLTCSKHEGIYCDSLADLIEQETGLFLSLFPRS